MPHLETNRYTTYLNTCRKIFIRNFFSLIIYFLCIFIVIGDWQDRLKDKFLGTTLQLKSPDVLVNADDRFELLTESMGTVKIDLYVLVRNFDKFGCHL